MFSYENGHKEAKIFPTEKAATNAVNQFLQ